MLPYWSKEAAANASGTGLRKWWRKGVKERSESYGLGDDLDGDRFRSVEAFDGQIVRGWGNRPDGRKAGSVLTVETADWHETPRTNPYAMLFEYYNLPWSEVVKQATEFRAVEERRDGRASTKVALKHPKAALNCELLFDERHRLVERRFFRKPLLLGSKPDPDLAVKETFSDYRNHALPSGEAMSFPHASVVTGYLGRTGGGALLCASTREIKILDIKFNVDLPDSLFDLDIPKDAAVYDGVSELGFLEPGDRPASVFPEEARRQWIVLGAVVAVVLLAAGGLVAHRRWRALRPETRPTPARKESLP
jgi:hypothetical protein